MLSVLQLILLNVHNQSVILKSEKILGKFFIQLVVRFHDSLIFKMLVLILSFKHGKCQT